MMRNVGFYSVCMHARAHLCVFYTHAALKASRGKKSLRGQKINQRLSDSCPFPFPTPYPVAHASYSPGNDWLLGLVSQLRVCVFHLPSLPPFRLPQALLLLESGSSRVVTQLIREGPKQNNHSETRQLFPTRSDGRKVTFIPANEESGGRWFERAGQFAHLKKCTTPPRTPAVLSGKKGRFKKKGDQAGGINRKDRCCRSGPQRADYYYARLRAWRVGGVGVCAEKPR